MEATHMETNEVTKTVTCKDCGAMSSVSFGMITHSEGCQFYEESPKHTPGPWRYDPQIYTVWKDLPDFAGKPQGSFELVTDIGAPNDGSDADANGRLIAAAPDLLAVLQAIVEAWDSPKEKAALSYTHLEAAKFSIRKARVGR